MTDGTFNEQTLYDSIVEKWGEYGAHADVFRMMLAEIERLRAELRTFVPWGEWLTVEGLCSHDAREGCTRTDHVQHPMFVRWETVCG